MLRAPKSWCVVAIDGVLLIDGDNAGSMALYFRSDISNVERMGLMAAWVPGPFPGGNGSSDLVKWRPMWNGALDTTFNRYVWIVTVPIWIPLFGLASLSFFAWARYLRRLRPGCCPKCGYQLAGLQQGSVCPECGTAPRLPRAD
jgi:hypothetical protein